MAGLFKKAAGGRKKEAASELTEGRF